MSTSRHNLIREQPKEESDRNRGLHRRNREATRKEAEGTTTKNDDFHGRQVPQDESSLADT